ncbi:MAG: gamma-glutamyltransferase, partial [Planctomycetes bacterium]|nr:gamma-glutamyltransferase [Planctomycetota bacterium]
ALATSVVDPKNSSMGGQGFATVYVAKERAVRALNFYGVAPRGEAMQVEGLDQGRSLVVPEAREHLAYDAVLDLLRRREIDADRFMTHRWPLAQAAEAFSCVASGAVLKGMIEMP